MPSVQPPETRAPEATWLAMLGLAAAMGIGRFAFTPLMPLMQAELGLAITEAGWLASANYLGYLAGALGCVALDPRPHRAAIAGLVLVAASTLGMAGSTSLWPWLLLRFVAGLASAMVFVGISGWVLAVLPPAERAARSGWIYAGVGIGIAGAGLLSLGFAAAGAPSASAWLALGGVAALAAAIAAVRLRAAVRSDAAPAASQAPGVSRTEVARLVLCYAALGFGYILPATFLPALARELVPDPRLFGWTWPVFGAAAALSTIVASTLWRQTAPRRIWAVGQGVMAAGVLAPLVHAGPLAVALSALAVGATFMVVTMAGMQQARLVAGAAAPRLIAAMTAAFAGGQLAGPLLVRGSGAIAEALAAPSLAAAAALLLSSALLVLPLSRSARHANPRSI